MFLQSRCTLSPLHRTFRDATCVPTSNRTTSRVWHPLRVLCFCVICVQSQVALVVTHPPANARDARDPASIPGCGRFPGEGNGNPLPVFLPGKFHGERSLAGYSPWGRKELDTTKHARTHTHTHTEYSSTGSLFQVQDVSVQFSSVAQLCLTLCNPMDCSTPGLPVHHQLLELDCTVLLYFSRCCPVRSKRFYFCVCLLLCVIYMKSVINLLQYSTT